MEQKSILGTESINKLILKLSLPSITAQIINILYNIVDRIYVGHMENDAEISLTALGVCAPLLILISAFSSLIGGGAGPLSAIAMGEDDYEKAEKIIGTSFWMLLVLSGILTVVTTIFKIPLLRLFGASDNVLYFADQYASIYILGTVFVLIALGLNVFISAQGKATTAMFSVLIGAITNIVLDPIFIFVFDMGVRGAAIATVISQAVSAFYILKFLFSNNSSIKLKKEYVKYNPTLLKNIMGLGVSSFTMMGTESAVSTVFNRGLLKYGSDMYVGAMTIMNSAMQLLTMPISGFTQGIQPIISFNYGAKKYDRVKEVVKKVVIISFSYTLLYSVFVYLNPRLIASIFSNSEVLRGLVVVLLPIFMAGMWPFGIQMTAQTYFVGTSQPKISMFIASLRKIILLIPLAIILPKHFGVIGIIYAEPISDILSVTTATILFLINLKKLNEKSI